MLQVETLREFRQRTEPFMKDSIGEATVFATSEGLVKKINGDGSFRTFAGDTVVFLLDDAVKVRLEEIQSRLYQACGELLAEPIKPATFHMTLHDLSNGEQAPELEMKMQENQWNVGSIFEELSRFVCAPGSEIGLFQLKLRSSYVFNMVNTSIVLGFEPVDEENCRKLMELYEQFQNVVPVSYPLTPHVTVAYFKPGVYEGTQIERLKAWMLDENMRDTFEITLDLEQLVYQRFTNMNQYNTVF